MTENTVQTVRKLTMKSMGAQPDIVVLVKMYDANKEATLPLCRLFGRVTKVKPGESDYGSFCKFVGVFKGVNLQTGEAFRSAVALFPKALEEEIEAAMSLPGVESLDFAYEIGAKFDATAATKYVYVFRSLMAPTEHDPLDLLEKQIMGGGNLLTGPSSEPAPAPAAVPEPAKKSAKK